MPKPAANRPRLAFAKPVFLIILVLLAGGLLYIFLPFVHAILLGIFLTIVLQPVHKLLKRLCFPGFPLVPDGNSPLGYGFSTPEPTNRFLRWWRSFISKLMIIKLKDCFSRQKFSRQRTPAEVEQANDWHHNLSAIITLTLVLLIAVFTMDLAWRTVRDQSIAFLKNNQSLSAKLANQSPAEQVATKKSDSTALSKLEKHCNSLEDRHRHNSLFQSFVISKIEALLNDPELDTILANTVNKLTAQSIFSSARQEQPAASSSDSTPEEIELALQLSTEQEQETRPQYVIYPFICKLQPHLQRLAINYLGYFSFLPKKLLSFGGVLLGQGLALLVFCFFLLSKGTYIRGFFREIGFFDPQDFDELMDQAQVTSQSILWGSLGCAACQLLVLWIAYTIAGLPAGILTLLSAISIAIPVVGTPIVWCPCAYYLFTIGKGHLSIVLIIAGIIVSYLENFIRPALMRLLGTGKLKVPFGLMFFALLGGLITFKFPGVIYGPMLAALFLTAIEIFKRRYNREDSGISATPQSPEADASALTVPSATDGNPD